MSLAVNVEKKLHHFTLQADFSIGNENLAVVDQLYKVKPILK
mgnify:CR=1 FL=1